MPLYEFTCLNCHKDFSLALTVRSYEQRGFECPHCHSRQVERTITHVEVVTSRKS
jgi:putative FmdB family regulatory protein